VEDRARSQDDDDAFNVIENKLKNITKQASSQTPVHTAVPSSADVPDDQLFHLVLFRPACAYKTDDDSSPAMIAAKEYLEYRGTSPRIHRNMIAFLAPDSVQIEQLKREAKMFLAWKSIQQDADMLNLDTSQRRETLDALAAAEKIINERIGEIWRQLIVPVQEGTEPIQLSVIRTTEKNNPLTKAINKLKSDELLIEALSPKILSMEMERYNLWQGKNHITVRELWSHYTQYVYLHRLQNRLVLERALEAGIRSGEYFAYAKGVAINADNNTEVYDGLIFSPANFIQMSPESLIVKADAVKAQIENAKILNGSQPLNGKTAQDGKPAAPHSCCADADAKYDASIVHQKKQTQFYGTIKIEPVKMGTTAGNINTEILRHLSGLAGVSMEVSLDIRAAVPNGIPEDIVRTVRENCRTMKFESFEFD
jgi:hypothetical protein